MHRWADRVVRFRWVIIVLFLAVTAFFARQLPQAEINPEMKQMLPPGIESRINTERIDELFGGTEMLMVILKTDDVLEPDTLGRVKSISRQMKRIKGVDKVLSLFELKNIKSEDGTMIIEPAVKHIPGSSAQREELRREIAANDIVFGSVVSEDFSLTAVIALLKADVNDEDIVGEMEALIDRNPGEEEVVLGGLPSIRARVTGDIKGDMQKFLPLGILIMLFFLYVCFRQLRGVVLPFLVVIMSILVAVGSISLLGWKIHIITIVLPVVLIAVANDYGIHMIARYQEHNVGDNPPSKKELAKEIFLNLGKPVVLTGLTTMAGFLCLLGHRIIPAQQLGVLAAIGILFALAASLLFIPAIISLLPRARSVLTSPVKDCRRPMLERVLVFFAGFVSRKPRSIMLVALLGTLVVFIGVFFVNVDADPNNYYSQDSPVVYASSLINQNLGGAQSLSLVFSGDIKEPRLMKKMDSFEQELGAMPEIGYTTSIARVVRQMGRALNDAEEEGYDRIPDTREAVAQYFELYAMSGDPEDFEKMVDFPYENALMTLRINTTSTPKLRRVLERVEEIIGSDRDVRMVGGFGMIISEIADLVVNGQFLSLGLAIFVVGILLMVLFRSVVAGLVSAIPLAFSIMALFGLMGYLGIELNIATAMLSSIMIGVGVDYTIHFLWRYREERQQGLSAHQAVEKTLTTTGRGIVFNAFSVIVGFVVLMVSSFLPVRFFGLLVVVSIFSCLGGALILIPSVCLVFKPKFLEPLPPIENQNV